jgi:ribonuclease D
MSALPSTVRVGPFLHLPRIADEAPDGDLHGRTSALLQRAAALLEEHGASAGDVIRLRFYVDDLASAAAVRSAHAAFFGSDAAPPLSYSTVRAASASTSTPYVTRLLSSESPPEPRPTLALIDTPDALADLIRRALEQPCVAVDTEFVWERTYYANLGVVQIGWGENEAHLIDAVALDGQLEPLGDLLRAPDVRKVLHDAPQDLQILHRATGAEARNVFDTRIGAGFAGLGGTLSLQRLISATVGVDLPKTESRSDWLRRPLSKSQVQYAEDDVRFLCAAADAIERTAREAGRMDWLVEEMAVLESPDLYAERDPDEMESKVRGTGKMKGKERSVVRELAAWREREARERNLPRRHVISDEAVILLARKRPQDPDDAAAMKGVPRRYADELVRQIATGVDRARTDPPERAPRRDDDETSGARIDLMLAYLKGRGLASGVDPSLVATRSDVADVAEYGGEGAPPDLPLLRGWRRAFIGDDLIALQRGELAIRVNPQTRLPEPA